MTKLNTIDRAALKSAVTGAFTFKGDGIFRTYTQAVRTLNKLERLGLLKREDHDPSMYVATAEGRDAHKYPNSYSVVDCAKEFAA